jgi:hypothetical protein
MAYSLFSSRRDQATVQRFGGTFPKMGGKRDMGWSPQLSRQAYFRKYAAGQIQPTKGYLVKLTSILAACLTVVASAMGQGNFVDFSNSRIFSTPADRLVYLDHVGGTPLVGTNWVAQLYYGADPCSLVAHTATPARFRPPGTSVPGTWVGGLRSLSGFVPGDTLTLQVRVWDIAQFLNFETAVAEGGIFGVSLPFQYTIPSGSPPPPPSAFFMENFRAFALTSDFPVNQAPTFTGGPDVSVAEDSGSQAFAEWATDINPGAPNEAGQSLTFFAFNNNSDLFSVQPAVSSSGDLTFTPAPNGNGSAVVTVVLQDDGGTGCDTSDPYSFTITVTPVNDPPVAIITPPPFLQLFPDSTEPLLLAVNGLDTRVILNGSRSFDDSTGLQFTWFENGTPIAFIAVPTNIFAVGEHTVTLVVSDGEFSDSDSLFFEVITSAQAVELIILAVEDTDLPHGTQTALIASLDAAAAAFEEGDMEKGVHKLETFLEKVEEDVAPIDLALAEYLSFAAQALINAIE